MIAGLFTRRDFSAGMAMLFACFSRAQSAFATATHPSQPSGHEEISRKSESIHQEIVFQASRKRVYEALVDSKQFTLVTALGPLKKAVTAEISPEAGGAFTCFDGHILGRQIDLVSNERIVQAWRVANWEPGVYSIARFEFKEQGSETRLVFDHLGFPNGKAEELASGWKEHYWEPLHKYLASPTGA